MTHIVPRAALPENGVFGFEVSDERYLLADVDGEVQAYAIVGPAAPRAAQAAVAEGRLPLPAARMADRPGDGRLRRGRPVPVPAAAGREIAGEQIRVSLPGS